MTIGQKFRALRKLAGLSQTELACKLYTTRQQISHIEKGHIDPHVCFVIAMSKMFKVSTDFILLEGEGIEEFERVKERSTSKCS